MPSHPEENTSPDQQGPGDSANPVAGEVATREEAAGAPRLLSGPPPLLSSAINSLLVSSWGSPSPARSKHRLLTLCCPQPEVEAGGGLGGGEGRAGTSTTGKLPSGLHYPQS